MIYIALIVELKQKVTALGVVQNLPKINALVAIKTSNKKMTKSKTKKR